MENRRLLIAISATTAMSFAVAQARTFYVASSGEDSSPGAIESPLRRTGTPTSRTF